jgi:hypothetical protein
MPVFAQNFSQPFLGIATNESLLLIGNGMLLLDFSQFQWGSPNDWSRDDILWDIAVDLKNWPKEVYASVLVFPLTFDAFDNPQGNQLGWGIDSFGLRYPQVNPLPHSTTQIGLTAKLALKSRNVEVLRVGYQLTLSASA